MNSVTFGVGAAIGLVAIILIAGLANMLRGGEPSVSQKLMRWRVGLQTFAVALIFLVLWVRG